MIKRQRNGRVFPEQTSRWTLFGWLWISWDLLCSPLIFSQEKQEEIVHALSHTAVWRQSWFICCVLNLLKSCNYSDQRFTDNLPIQLRKGPLNLRSKSVNESFVQALIWFNSMTQCSDHSWRWNESETVMVWLWTVIKSCMKIHQHTDDTRASEQWQNGHCLVNNSFSHTCVLWMWVYKLPLLVGLICPQNNMVSSLILWVWVCLSSCSWTRGGASVSSASSFEH